MYPHSKVDVEDGVKIPSPCKPGRTPNKKYPFDTMGVSQSFHVPKTEKKPNPAKSLASTVHAANKRYRIGLGPEKQEFKHFIIRTVDTFDPKGPGARVFRIN